MNFVTLIPLIAQALTAIQPLLTGATANGVTAAGSNLIPVIQSLVAAIAPGSPLAQAKVPLAVTSVTGAFDPDIVKWIQQVLNLAGNKLDIDGVLGPNTLAAADAFADKELGIVPGGVASTILRSALQALAAAKK